MNPFVLFWLMLKASLFSTGGFGNLPSLHADLIARGWASEAQFTESLAVGQVAPGPNGLWVLSLGYLVDGLLGAVLALVAISLPPLLVLGVLRLDRRAGHHPAAEGFMRGLGLAVVGIFVVVLADLGRKAEIDLRGLAIGLVCGGLALSRRVPVALILALAAVAGYGLY